MIRHIADLKVAAVCLGLLTAIAGCDKTTKPTLNNGQGVGGQSTNAAAVPGSERDFIVNVGDRVYFVVNQSSLTTEAQGVLSRQAAWLKQYPNVTIQVEGHADERGTREYNIALSARRATAARQYLLSQGVSPSRVSTIAYGKERPVALCEEESCYSRNRRAVTVVTGGAVSG